MLRTYYNPCGTPVARTYYYGSRLCTCYTSATQKQPSYAYDVAYYAYLGVFQGECMYAMTSVANVIMTHIVMS